MEYWYRRYFTGARAVKGAESEGLLPSDVAIANSRLLELSAAQVGSADHQELGSAFLAAKAGYMELFEQRRLELDAVLRTLFRLFQWIDESGLAPKQRWHYAALVRAQLSWVELAYLLYNAFSDEGAPFAEYVNRYALLDNLVGGKDPLISIIRKNPELIRSSAPLAIAGYKWPLLPDAFSSDIARPKLLADQRS
jgi:hypothetical protein